MRTMIFLMILLNCTLSYATVKPVYSSKVRGLAEQGFVLTQKKCVHKADTQTPDWNYRSGVLSECYQDAKMSILKEIEGLITRRIAKFHRVSSSAARMQQLKKELAQHREMMVQEESSFKMGCYRGLSLDESAAVLPKQVKQHLLTYYFIKELMKDEGTL